MAKARHHSVHNHVASKKVTKHSASCLGASSYSQDDNNWFGQQIELRNDVNSPFLKKLDGLLVCKRAKRSINVRKREFGLVLSSSHRSILRFVCEFESVGCSQVSGSMTDECAW